MCAHILADRGELDFDAPVTEYWPEFAAAGKADVPVSWLISHQVGLIDVDRKMTARRGARLGPGDRRAGRVGAAVAAGHAARLPRGDLRLARGRGRPPDLGQEPRRLLRRRDRRAARPRLLDRDARRGARPGGAGDPVRAATRPRARARQRTRSRREHAARWPTCSACSSAPTTCWAGRCRLPAARSPTFDEFNRPEVWRAEIPRRQRHHQRAVARRGCTRRSWARSTGSGSSRPRPSTRRWSARSSAQTRCSVFEIPFGLGFMLNGGLMALGVRPAFGHFGAGGSLGFADHERNIAGAT